MVDVTTVPGRKKLIDEANEFLRAHQVVTSGELEAMSDGDFRAHHTTVRFWLAAMLVDEGFGSTPVFATLLRMREDDCRLECRRREDLVRDRRAIESLDHDRTSARYSVWAFWAAVAGVLVTIALAVWASR